MSGHGPVGIVLAGGASKRMGVDKSTLVVGGKPMVVSVADALWEAGCSPVECQGGDPTAIGAYGLDVFADPEPGSGPVHAIHAALERHPQRDLVVAACDLADLDASAVAAVIASGLATNATVVAAATGDELHMMSWWRRGSAAAVGAVIADGERSYQGVLHRLGVVAVQVSEDSVRNVNTPTDAAAGR